MAAYAKTAVYALRQAEVVAGYPSGLFAPQRPITRAETAKIVSLTLALTEV
ncbi:MAG: S-layer homology domain-containing protein [Oscillospiraceae bacterium]|nr:S-layer homology domain-containing protein [Oscillospiraceae bacterium]